ncbi:Ribose 5-phosphate isomerase B [hydrothermal vent metagenome]|uniref:Ribose 5-phosphate isomerase B n=1 Tax=hydrothermal vent metagenome TaxID=652676 RepID=A0A3B0S4T1_9ZZZZ
MSREKIVLASDHGGYDLKVILKNFLVELGYDVLDLGCDGPQSVDYPDYAHALADAIKEQKAARGVLVCGSGIGISIAVNRHPHIRAALVHDRLTAELSRQHNDANVVVFGGRVIGIDVARDCLKAFLDTNFEGGRHQRRIDKMS